MSDTNTTTPTISNELNAQVQDNKAKLAIVAGMQRVASTQFTEAQNRMLGVLLLKPLGIDENVPILQAINIAVDRREAKGYTMSAIADRLGELLDMAAAGQWDELTEELTGEKKEVKKPAPRAKKQVSSTARFDLPTIDVPPAPAADPANPMAVFGEALRPMVERKMIEAQADLINRLSPVFDEVASRIGSTSQTGSVDESKVKEIINKSLCNGTGEEIKKMVTVNVPDTLKQVLEKAADAISAAAPQYNSAPTLHAAFTPIPDPHYAWTEDLEQFADMIDTARKESPQNVMLTGPTGCGKSEFAIQFAAKYGLRVMFMDCANIREARDWFGERGASGGSTYFEPSQFVLALEAGNVVIILDEFNRATAHVRNTLFPILDPTRRESFVQELKRVVKVGPGTVFLASLNLGLEYTGTHENDRAMDNRFTRRVELTYLPQDKEIAVLTDKVDGLKKSDARKLVELANVVRSKSAGFGGTLTKSISTRQLIAAAKDFVLMGVGSFRYTIFNHFDAEGGTDSERAQVVAAWQGKGYDLTAPAKTPSSATQI